MKKMHWFSQLAYHKGGCNHDRFLKNSAEVFVCLLFVCLWSEEAYFLFIYALVTGNPHPSPNPGETWGIRQLNEKKEEKAPP